MDQESSRRDSVSVPQIVGPERNDSFDGRTVTISGTADREVTVRLWDWLSPVATTTADESGHWSVTLHNVEVGDHMYGAEAFRDSQEPSGRSQVVAVRVAPQARSSAESPRRTSRRWKLPTTEFARKLTVRRRSNMDEDAGQTGLEDTSEPTGTEPGPAPATKTVESPLLSDEGSPPDDAPLPQPTAVPSSDPFNPAAQPGILVAHPAIEVSTSTVVKPPQAIEGSPWVLVQSPTPIDLGAADSMLETVPPVPADTQIEAAPPAPQRIWTERVIVEQPPTV